MLNQTFEAFNLPSEAWSDQPDPAELAALEDIRQAGWFDREPPLLVSLLDLVEAVSSVSDNEDDGGGDGAAEDGEAPARRPRPKGKPKPKPKPP